MTLTSILSKRTTSWNIEKNNKLEKKKITVIGYFSDESTLSSNSDIDEVINIHSKKS